MGLFVRDEGGSDVRKVETLGTYATGEQYLRGEIRRFFKV